MRVTDDDDGDDNDDDDDNEDDDDNDDDADEGMSIIMNSPGESCLIHTS